LGFLVNIFPELKGLRVTHGIFEVRTIWIVDAHGYGKRFIVRADEKLTAFVELQRAIHQFAVCLVL